MNSMSDLLTPTVLTSIIIVVGYLVGKIRIYALSLDLSAILIIAVVAGCLCSSYMPEMITPALESDLRLFSQLGTVLFVAAIGLSSGDRVANGLSKKSVVCFVTGSIMVATGFLFAKVLGWIDPEMDSSLLLGILCGALTSTPGLSTLCEEAGTLSELAVLGYGCSYPFGVISVVLLVQWMVRGVNNTPVKETGDSSKLPIKNGAECFVWIFLSVFFGSIVGELTIPVLNISLGTSGGVLLAGIGLGILTKKLSVSIQRQHISCYRSLGLMLFFVGIGFPAGNNLAGAFEVKLFVYGAFLTALPILVGYLLSRWRYKGALPSRVAVVAGGMTSTPAIGVLAGNAKLVPDLSAYSFAYLGGLITMIFLMRVIL